MLTDIIVRRKGEKIIFYGCRVLIGNYYEEDPGKVKEQILSIVQALFPKHNVIGKEERHLDPYHRPFSSHLMIDTLFTLELKPVA